MDTKTQENTAQVLDILIRRSRSILLDPAKLAEALTENGISPVEVYKILLITGVSGFRKLVQSAPDVRQADIELFVTNAMLETGLRKDTILALTADLLSPIGVSSVWRKPKEKEDGTSQKQAFVIPYETYETILENYETSFRSMVREETAETEPDYTKLIPLAEAGLPRAQLYLGTYLIAQSDEKAQEYGRTLLEMAEKAGESRASGVLGDYWYRSKTTDGLQKAYEYYTAFGGAALTSPQRKRFQELLDTRKYNLARIGSGFFLWAVLTAVCFFLQQEVPVVMPLFSFCPGVLYLVLRMIQYRRKPFGSFGFVPLTVFILWYVPILIICMIV